MRIGFWLLIGIAAFFLITEHRAHLVAGMRWLPIAALLACPLIHMFSHRGHGRRRMSDSVKRFGDAYNRYMAEVPRFIPRRHATADVSGVKR